MSATLKVAITAQIEEFNEQLVKAKPLGPWKLQGIGSTPESANRSLQRQLQKRFSKKPDPQVFRCELPEEFATWELKLELAPPSNDVSWQEPIPVEVECFRWQLSGNRTLVRVPAVQCVLIAKSSDLPDEEVQRQAQAALTRMAKESDLLLLRRRFATRKFSYRTILVEFPRVEYQDNEAARRKPRIKTLRNCATELRPKRLSPVFGLDQRALELGEHFKGDKPQSVLLVGPPGVGKTALVQHFVRIRHELDLEARSVWTTSGARIVSGMSGLGMWQDRCAKLIRQAKSMQAILHLGSLFELIEAGKIDGQPGVASMIRTAIDRRNLIAIAECTPEQLAVIEKNDPMLLRVFTQIQVKEPSESQTLDILRQSAESTNSNYSEQALLELYHLHHRFATYSAMPSTALKLMRTLEDNLGAKQRLAEVGSEQIAEAFSKQTGLPRFLIDDSVKLDLQEVESRLSSNVIGQSEPIKLVVDLLATLKARLVRPGKPLASLLFIGPTGVGKTEMAKAIARLMYNDPSRMLRIDMSEYSTPWSIAKLIGKPGDGDGALTTPVREQPFTVVLLDEFEKADANVFDLLLQVLGEGRLTDSQGQLADFRNAVVIMTSNLGADTFKESQFGFGADTAQQWREHFEREIRSFVRPEFLARIDKLVPFQPLSQASVRTIAERELEMLTRRTGLKYANVRLDFRQDAIELLCRKGYQPKFGARPLRRAIEEEVTIPLANHMSQLDLQQDWLFTISANEEKVHIEAEQIDQADVEGDDRESEILLVNEWMHLGAMARAARSCEPLRDIENRLARNKLRSTQLEKKLVSASGPRRITAFREELARCQSEIQSFTNVRKQLLDATHSIHQEQLSLMLAWHRSEEIETELLREQLAYRNVELKQCVENVLRGRSENRNTVTLLVTCKSSQRLKQVYDAYIQLAQANRWQCDTYIAKHYDPRLDLRSLQYQAELVKLQGQPAVTLLAKNDSDAEPEKLCDLFRLQESESPLFEKVLGFALHFRGEGVGVWLEEEHGVIHFFDPSTSGAKRRVRLRTSVFDGKLHSIELDENWLELSVPESSRNQMRQFNFAEQTLENMAGQSITFAKDKLADAMFELMKIEHESALWKAVGYHGIPVGARLRGTNEPSWIYEEAISLASE